MGKYSSVSPTLEDLTITGNLTVEGTSTTTTVSSTNTEIADKLIEIANGTTGTPSGDAGIIIERGSSDNAAIIWDESRDEFVLGTTSATGGSTGDLTVTPGNVSVERIGAGTEQAEAEVHAKRDASSGGQYSTTATVIAEDDARPSVQLVGSANNIGLIQFGDNAAVASGQIYYDHSSDKLRIDAGGSTARLTLDSSGNVTAEGSILLKEKADAVADVAAYGQLWVNTATPNELYFTTDAGNDIAITSGTAVASGAVDLNGLSEAAIADGDSIVFIDANDSNASRKETLSDFLDTVAGTVGTTGLDRSGATLVVSDLHPVGVNGSANQLITDDGDGTVTSESGLTYDGSTLAVTGDVTVSGGDITYGNGQNATLGVTATAHDAAGKTVTISSGSTTAGTTNNIAGGDLTIAGGQGKGSGVGGDIIFKTAAPGSSGSSINSLTERLRVDDNGVTTITGDLKVHDGSDTATMTWDSGIFELRDSNSGSTQDILRAYYNSAGSYARVMTHTINCTNITAGTVSGAGASNAIEIASGASAGITLDAGTDIQLEPGGNDIIVVPDGSTESFRFTANGTTSATWDVVGDAIIDADGGDFTFSDGGVVRGSITLPSLGTSSTDIVRGAGMDAVQNVYRHKFNGLITTVFHVDLGEGTNISAKGTQWDAIGNSGGGNAYLAQLTAAGFGYVHRIDMTCVEAPTASSGSVQAAIGIVLHDQAVAYDGATKTGNYVTAVNPTSGFAGGGTDWTLGMSRSSKSDNMNASANYYMYLANTESSAADCTYNAGKFVITVYGTTGF